MTIRYRESNTLTSGQVHTLSTSLMTLSSSYYLPATASTNYGSYSSSLTTHGATKTMMDHVTPNWKSLIAKGEIINKPMAITEVTETDPVVACDYTKDTYKYMLLNPQLTQMVELYQQNKIVGEYPFHSIYGLTYPNAVSAVDTERIMNLAVTDAYAKINNSDLLIGAAIAESGKTTRSLLTLARKVIKVLRRIKHPKPLPKRFSKKAYLNALRESEELYMQARYNLRPLYYDILGTMKLTVEKYPTNRFTFRGFASDENSSSSYEERTLSLFPGIVFGITKTATYSAEARAGVLCSMDEQTLWKRIGISLIPETMWELTPFSFILDWFWNFGSVISSWAPSPGIKQLTSWCTLETNSTQTIGLSVASVNDIAYTVNFQIGAVAYTDTKLSLSNATRIRNSRTKTRFVNPTRTFTPSLNINLDSLKCLDLAIIGKNLLKNISNVRNG